jgi:hypothetical protein
MTGKKQIWECSEGHQVVIGFANEGNPNAYAMPCKHPKCKQVSYPKTGDPGERVASYEWYRPDHYDDHPKLLSKEQLEDLRKGLLLLRRVEYPRINTDV